MKRGLPICLALLLVISSSLFAEDESAKDQTVTLTHKFSTNQTVRYKILQNITGSRTFPGSDKPTPVNAELKSVVRMRCDKVAEDGTATVSFEFESGTLKIGKRQTNAFVTPSAPRMLQVTPGGKVTFPPEEQQVGATSTRRVLMDAGAIEPLIILVGLPEAPVSSGGSWLADVVLPSTAKIRIASALNEVKEVAGEQAAVITQTQTSFQDSSSPNRQDGQSKLIFGIESGRLLWAEGSIHSIAAITTPRSGKEPATGTLTLDIKFKVETMKPS